jgi:apolipoprotein N-acyltransferase
VIAAACGGVLYFLGYLGWDVWPCLFVFLVPLWSALERVRARLGPAVLGGLVFGLAAYAGGFRWLWPLLDVFLAGNRILGAALWTAYGLWFALGFAAYAAVFARLRRRGWPVAVAGVGPLLALEWLQPHLFPVNAGSALVHVPLMVQTADLGGPLLLTALVGAANVGAFETWAWWRGRRPAPVVAGGAVLVVWACALAYGLIRVAALDATLGAASTLRVGIVQANLGLLEKRTLSLVTHRRHLEQTRALLADGEVDLVVWPETAYVRGLRGPLPISGRPVREELTVPLLFGGSAVHEEHGRVRAANAAFLVGADGTIRDAYAKNLLIPFAEYVPLAGLIPAVARWFPHAQEFGAAAGAPALRLGPWRIATPICYEVVRPDFVRWMVRESAPHVLVTLANDAWFGDSPEPWIHLALARLRAVEHRRFLVRATNSGVSAIVDPGGRLVVRSGLLTRETLRGTVHPLDGTTLYARLGDWPGWLALAAVALAAAFPRRRPGVAAAAS